MARNPDWKMLLIGMHLDEGVLIRDVLGLLLEIIRKSGDGEYHRKEGTLTRDIIAAYGELVKAETLSKKCQSIIEDKNGNK